MTQAAVTAMLKRTLLVWQANQMARCNKGYGGGGADWETEGPPV